MTQPSAISAARIKSAYAAELKDFSSWFFEKFATSVDESDPRRSLFIPSSLPKRYFEFRNKLDFVRHMEEEIDNNVVFLYILDKRDNHFWPAGQKGKAFFDHLRCGLKLRLNELSTTAEYYTLPAQVNIKHFFEGLDKKLIDKAKEEGWDDNSCDSVPWSVYSTICGVIMKKNVQHWLMFILQWNLMSRSVDVTKINVSTISFSMDMLTLQFSHEKTARKKNEKPTTVHVASNPANPIVCPVLAFAVNFCSRNMDSLRLFDGSSIQQHYSNAIKSALEEDCVLEELKHLGLSEAKIATHTLRKSAASYAAGGTDGTPMHFTILLRGGWSIGNVLDRYFSLAENGDRVLANMLAGRAYFNKEFSRLIPHFKKGHNVKSNVLKSIFCGKYVEDNFDEIEGILQMFTAQLVYHNSTLKTLLGANSTLINIMDRNLLHTAIFKKALGPDFESSTSAFRATGQGGSIIYQRLDSFEARLINIEFLIEHSQHGSNVSNKEFAKILKQIQQVKISQVENFKKLQDDIRCIGSTSTTDTVPISMNVFVHQMKRKKIWKVSPKYQLPHNFKELTTQYVFSNPVAKQTALRDCTPGNIFYNQLTLTAAENNKEKKKFAKHFSKSIIAVEVFLQFSWLEMNQKFCSLTSSFPSYDRWSRGAEWNSFFSAAYAKFANVVLATRKRKRNKNELTARTVFYAISKKREGNTTFISDLRRRSGLPPSEKSKAMKWSFKLPQLRLAEEHTSSSPLLITDNNEEEEEDEEQQATAPSSTTTDHHIQISDDDEEL